MKIQWQARTFHSFGANGLENVIVYNVPVEGKFGCEMMNCVDTIIENGITVWFEMVNPTTLRVAVKFD
jgi:hypothetical protein